MYSLIATSFLATLAALAKVALVIIASAWLVRRGVFEETHIRALTSVVVNLSLPCLIFYSITKHFDVSAFPHWWKFPLIGAALTCAGLVLSLAVFKGKGKERNPLIAMAAFQNAGYLVLPIGEVLFPARFDRFSIYLFLLLLVYTPLLWSLASFLISHRGGSRIKWNDVITIPFCTTVLAMFLVFTGLEGFIPDVFQGSVEMLGKSCVPLATVVLGCTMGTLRVSRMPSFSIVSRVVAVKLLAMPVLMLLFLEYTGVSSGGLETAFWILQASSPPATALALQTIHFGGDEKLVCGVLVVTYLAALFTIPLFYSLAQVLL